MSSHILKGFVFMSSCLKLLKKKYFVMDCPYFQNLLLIIFEVILFYFIILSLYIIFQSYLLSKNKGKSTTARNSIIKCYYLCLGAIYCIWVCLCIHTHTQTQVIIFFLRMLKIFVNIIQIENFFHITRSLSLTTRTYVSYLSSKNR